mmetsp:Transcript_99386/g.310241  ORF Transcript_99386/g.310241 Transcript_99386/m.310241 type:complete len:144 (+) Transcript_99386:1414-1845(+)
MSPDQRYWRSSKSARIPSIKTSGEMALKDLTLWAATSWIPMMLLMIAVRADTNDFTHPGVDANDERGAPGGSAAQRSLRPSRDARNARSALLCGQRKAPGCFGGTPSHPQCSGLGLERRPHSPSSNTRVVRRRGAMAGSAGKV